jgi:hypothetical protein
VRRNKKRTGEPVDGFPVRFVLGARLVAAYPDD